MEVIIQNKEEIKTALAQQYQRIFDFLKELSSDDFARSYEEGKWSCGQHLLHLIKSTKAVNKALRMPKMALAGMFGKKNDRPERSYQEIVEKYHAKLAVADTSNNAFGADPVSAEDKKGIESKLHRELESLLSIIDKWDEEKMGIYLLPHPLLGKMTIREILLFTVYHTEHHFLNFQKGLSQ